MWRIVIGASPEKVCALLVRVFCAGRTRAREPNRVHPAKVTPQLCLLPQQPTHWAMSSMRDLFHSLSDIPGLTARVTPQAVSDFVRLAEVIRPSILFAQTVNWDPRCPPALPTNASIFLAVRVGLLVEDIHGLWDTLKREIWEAYVADSTQDIEDVEDDEDPDVDFEPPPVRTLEPRVRMHDDVARVSSLCTSPQSLYNPLIAHTCFIQAN